jgi:hypothetical protein
MANDPGMLVCTIRSWPKAQYLALALGIPPAAWEIPFLFASLGGPEISVFEAYDKPELGGLTARLKALTRPFSEAVHRDKWARTTIFGTEQLAVAFHPGTDFDEVVKRGKEDGYRVYQMHEILKERTVPGSANPVGRDEGLEDWQGYRLARWRLTGEDDRTIYQNTLALDWGDFTSASFFLLSRLEDISVFIELGKQNPPDGESGDWVVERLGRLAFDYVGHPCVLPPFLALLEDPERGHVPPHIREKMHRIDPRRMARYGVPR